MVSLNSTLLIIEDSVQNATIYQDYLRSKGCRYNLSIVASIAEGLDLCHTSPIDAVLLGCSVSGAEALNFLESLAQPSGCDLPAIVIVATENDARTAVRALKLGAQEYLLASELTPEILHAATQCAIEKARLQLQLQESHDRFRIAIDNVLDCVTICSAIRDESGQIVDFRFEYLNPPALAHNRMTAADLGRTLCEWLPASQELGLFAEYCRVVETGEPVSKENSLYSEVSGRQYLSGAYDLQLNKLDDGFIATWRNVSDRNHTELAFRESEERLRLTIEAAKLGTIDFNLLTGQVIWNATAEELMGYVPGAAATYTYADFEARIHPDDRANVTADLARVTIDRSDSTTEYRVILPDGRVRWQRGFGRFYYDDEGRAVRMLGTIEDITGNVEQILSISHDPIERLRSELAIKESEDLFRATFERVAVGICHVELSGRWMLVNPKLCDFLGYSEAELLATSFPALTHPEDLCTDLEYVRRLIDREIETYTMEKRYIHKLGHSVWANLTVTLRLRDTGAPLHFISVVEDINDRKQAELALLESERKFSAIFNQTFEFIGLLSLDGVLLEVNQAALDSVGTSRAEIVSKNFWETPWWAHSQELQQQLRAAIARSAQGEVICYEVSFPAANGDMMTTNFSLKPVRDELGRVTALVAEGYNITNLKRTEAALLESESRFRVTFEQAAVGIAHIGLDGRWLMFNDKLCDITGYTTAELLHSRFQDITHPDDLASNLESVRQLLAGEIQTYAMEKRYIHKLGRIVWANLTVSLRRDTLGAPLHFISIIEDINDRKQIEFNLQAQKVELAKTTALLELRNQELTRFGYIVSHDLKAPLRSISNLAAWIREDLAATIDPAIQTNLELMRSRISRMDRLIDGLLEYARVGSTKTSLETFSVELLLAEVVDSLSIPDSFAVELPTELPSITTNRVLLSQVLANLIGNAYKHHDRSNGRIRVTAQPDSKRWEFSVNDDGCGIAPENQTRVFDIFQTLSGADRQNTGIGLSIVKKIVENQGGNITLESQLGVGTTFYFTWNTNALALAT